MKSLTLALATFCLAAVSLAETAKNLAIDPKPREGGWVKRHETFNEISKKGEAQLVFLGDSITQGWEGNGKGVWAKFWAPLMAANFGIGGDRTEHVIWRLQNGNFDGIKPKLVVLMIGTNNTGHQGRPAAEHGGAVYTSSAEQTAEGVKVILDILGKKLPDTKVLLPASSRVGRQRTTSSASRMWRRTTSSLAWLMANASPTWTSAIPSSSPTVFCRRRSCPTCFISTPKATNFGPMPSRVR